MPRFLTIRVLFATTICAGTLSFVTDAVALMDPRFELDTKTLADLKGSARPRKTARKRSPSPHVGQASSASPKACVYTVKRGDHLFKILMRDYGLNNGEAESFIEEIKRENNIYDIKRLKVGQKIIIPPLRRASDGTPKPLQAVQVDDARNPASGPTPGQSFKMESPLPSLSAPETVARAHDLWDRIVPPRKGEQKPLEVRTAKFSLTLDPERYPTFARMDGGSIVLDQNGSIPPLVKSLIEERDPSVRVVAGDSSGTKHLMASLLEAAGFYSVEENFSMEFGSDPKLTVQADFKVEKTAESLIRQDLVLVNSGRTSLPPSLGEFLKKEGFSLYEPFASLKSSAQRDSRTIHYVSAKNQPEMIDDILSAFSVSPERDRSVDVFAADDNGISLSVRAERYFERVGQPYVVTSFDGDPMNYTLFRILETRGYKVIILEAQDDFRKIAEKIISRMKIKGDFAKHRLLQDGAAGYSLQMSGFKLDDALLPGGGIFLTDRPIDRIVRDLFIENGFNINSR